jgi:uncharacterized protein (TIGR02270 family)
MARVVAIIPAVVRQHAEEAPFLHSLRTSLTRAPHVRLRHIAGFDERLVAHLDGLSVAGEHGWPFCEAGLENLSRGTLFTAAIRAIEEKDQRRIDRCFGLAEAVPASRAGLMSAFGWLSRQHLQGMVVTLLASRDPIRRLVGIAACGMHRVDPGLETAQRIADTSPMVHARALRTAGEIACGQAVPSCLGAIRQGDPESRFWAAWSSVLLGNRDVALEALATAGLNASPHRLRAFRLALQAMSGAAAHDGLRQLAKDPTQLRWLMQGAGFAGDPEYVPWLIGHMANEKTARLAGEAFSIITGADLDELRLGAKRPENFESGPNDDPADPNVDSDPDDGLQWPDPQKVEKWWSANARRFQKGTRYFMGAPVTREHCIDVLKNGYQRQRILAAQYLCLLEPGTPLFNTSAPAWRQQRLLAKMS